MNISASVEIVQKAAEALAKQVGSLIETRPEVVVKVGTGLFGLNPAVLRLRFSENTTGTTTMEVSATAKEGLIKQHGGQQAVDLYVQRFRALAPAEWGI